MYFVSPLECTYEQRMARSMLPTLIRTDAQRLDEVIVAFKILFELFQLMTYFVCGDSARAIE